MTTKLSSEQEKNHVEQLIDQINKIIKEPWSDEDSKKGKKILLSSDWNQKIILSVSKKYKKAGWNVKNLVEITTESNHHIFNIKNPKWD